MRHIWEKIRAALGVPLLSPVISREIATMRHIWEKIREALGGYHRTPPTLSASDHAAAGEGLSSPGHAAVGDEAGAIEGQPPPDPAPAGDEGGGGGEGVGEDDLLSALPDDILLVVLVHLPSAAAAARTCVLSRRWSRLWTQLPELQLPLPAACAALARHEAPALRLLRIVGNDTDPSDAAAVLRLAAPRPIDELRFRNVVTKVREPHHQLEVEMPCFDRAKQLILRLGYLGLVLPPSGVFTELTVMDLGYVQFTGACDIGDTFSSARCPSLRQLRLINTQGVSNLTICSESLLRLWLQTVKGLQQLTVVSPLLIEMSIVHCFGFRQPVVDIIAPVMQFIHWRDRYDPISVRFGEMFHLQKLSTTCYAYDFPYDHQLLQCFQKIPHLSISIIYPRMMVNNQPLMALTFLPAVNLHLDLVTSGHAVISCVFHLLKISTSIRSLLLHISKGFQEQSPCSPSCVCHELQDWKTEELCLNSLEELDICGFSVANFDPSSALDEDLCKELFGLSGPDTCMKIYLYCNGTKVMYTP